MKLRNMLKEHNENLNTTREEILKLKDLLTNAEIVLFFDKDLTIKKGFIGYYLIDSFYFDNKKINCEFYLDSTSNQIEIVFMYLPGKDSEYTKTFKIIKDTEKLTYTINDWFFDKLNDYLDSYTTLQNRLKAL